MRESGCVGREENFANMTFSISPNQKYQIFYLSIIDYFEFLHSYKHINFTFGPEIIILHGTIKCTKVAGHKFVLQMR